MRDRRARARNDQRKHDIDAMRARLADADTVNKGVREEMLALGERSRHLEDAVANLAEQHLTGRDALALNGPNSCCSWPTSALRCSTMRRPRSRRIASPILRWRPRRIRCLPACARRSARRCRRCRRPTARNECDARRARAHPRQYCESAGKIRAHERGHDAVALAGVAATVRARQLRSRRDGRQP